MSSTSMVYEGVLSNGIKYKIHQSTGFSNKCDLAIEMAGEYISITTVVSKRNGSVEVIPMAIGRMVIKATEKSSESQEEQNIPPKPQDPVDLLSGVVSTKPETQTLL
jgi:hypothetical protein